MDKPSMKRFAAAARRELTACAVRHLSQTALLAGREQGSGTMEKDAEALAFAWFLRLTALCYLEANAYLPGPGCFFAEAVSPEALAGQYHMASRLFPDFFPEESAPSAFWIPPVFFGRDGLCRRLAKLLPREDWVCHVQIMGWFFQYYRAEEKNRVYSDLKKHVKLTAETLPVATQLFTPDWIGRYLVENSLLRACRRDPRPSGPEGPFAYYVPDAGKENSPASGRTDPAILIRVSCMDPCCGSGHLLAQLFDALAALYKEAGFSAPETAKSILLQNLYGVDLDAQAARLASFSLMMKGRELDPDFFTRGIRPHIHALSKIKNVPAPFADALSASSLCGSLYQVPEAAAREAAQYLKDPKRGGKELRDRLEALCLLARTYDVVVTNPPYQALPNLSPDLQQFARRQYPDSRNDLFAMFMERCLAMTRPGGYLAMITQHSWMFLTSFAALRRHWLEVETLSLLHLGAHAFADFHGEIVQTAAFVVRHGAPSHQPGVYIRLTGPDTSEGKKQLFFSGRERYAARQENFAALPGTPWIYWITPQILRAFREGRLLGSLADSRQGLATADNGRFVRQWTEVDCRSICRGAASEDDFAASGAKWCPYNKGGGFRRWYGNDGCVVDWRDRGRAIRNFCGSDGRRRSFVRNDRYYFRPCFSWSLITTGPASFRFKPAGFIFDVAGMSCFSEEWTLYLLGLCNSPLSGIFLSFLSPTVNHQCGDIARIPVLIDRDRKPEAETLVKRCIALSRSDWDESELSWDFVRHPLACGEPSLQAAWEQYRKRTAGRFAQLKETEERLNRLYLRIYGLEGCVSGSVPDAEVSVRRAVDSPADAPESLRGSRFLVTKADAARSFLSYAVGCILGRYSLDEPGLVYAGGPWRPSRYRLFKPVPCGFVMVGSEGPDSLSALLEAFLTALFGRDTLEENLAFLAEALGGSGDPRKFLRRYFLYAFASDHAGTYHNRPLYWQFLSGRKHAFQCLLYGHRFRKDTFSLMAARLDREKTVLEDGLEKVIKDGADRKHDSRKWTAAVAARRTALAELEAYGVRLRRAARQGLELDLDDGVAVNLQKIRMLLGEVGTE